MRELRTLTISLLLCCAFFNSAYAQPVDMVITFSKNWKYSIGLRFFKMDSHGSPYWYYPSTNQFYNLDQNEKPFRITIECNPGDKICFGAFPGNNYSAWRNYWGAGGDGRSACTACCYICAAGTYSGRRLTMTGGYNTDPEPVQTASAPNNDGGMNAADLLALFGLAAGVIAGSQMPSYQTPRYNPGRTIVAPAAPPQGTNPVQSSVSGHF